MKLVDRLILIDLIPKLLMSIALFSTLFLAVGPLLAAARFLEKGIPFWIVAAFVGWDFLKFVAYTFPLGTMVAALLGFERLSRDSEAVALYAAGISFSRLIVPVVVLGLLVSLVSYTFNDRIATYANRQAADISENRDQLFGETMKPFDFVNRDNDGNLQVMVHVEKGYSALTKTLRQVTIIVFNAQGVPTQTIHAARGQSLGRDLRTWRLYEVSGMDNVTGIPIRFATLDTQEINKTSDNMDFLRRDPETLNFHDLQEQIRQMKSGGSSSKEVRNAEVGLWFKTSLPFSCLIFGLVGAPLGMRSPRAVRFGGAVWALPIMLGYYIVYTSLSSIAQGGGVSPLLAAWLPNILGLFVGAGLIWKASR